MVMLGVSVASLAAFYGLMAHDLREPHGFGTNAYLWYAAGFALSGLALVFFCVMQFLA